MEDRIVIAAVIVIVMALVIGSFAARKIAERRRFKLRQMGRGKNEERLGLEPAE
jgi:hypothetical protein